MTTGEAAKVTGGRDILDRRTYSVPEAAALLGISRAKAYESVRRGQLRSISFGRRIVIPAWLIEELLAGDGNRRSG